MKQIEQLYAIRAPIEKVWQALTDARMAEQWGAGPAVVDARENGQFSYWGGEIHGTFTKLVPHQLIQQDWYGHDNPDQKFTVAFRFTAQNDMTIINLSFSGQIEDDQKDIGDWQDSYFTPIKEFLEK